MRKKYTAEIDAFIREHASELSGAEMQERLREEFGLDTSYKGLMSYCFAHGIRTSGRKRSRRKPGHRITTPEMDEFIREHVKGTGHQAMADLVNERFGTNLTALQIKAYYQRNKLNSGLTGHFKKGQPSWTKGLTWADYMSPEGQAHSRTTQFRKGMIPHNGGNPIGTIRPRDCKGRIYMYMKTGQPCEWRACHVVEWEKHHGPIPPDHIVTFCDGDSTNWHIDNLMLCTRAQSAVKNRAGIHGYDRASEEVANMIAEIKIATHRKQKEKRRADTREEK